MSFDMRTRYLEALELVVLQDLSNRTGRAYRTIQAYRSGYRRVTSKAARELVMYLRSRSEALHEAAERLEAALPEEEHHE